MLAFKALTIICCIAVFCGCDKDAAPASSRCGEFRTALLQEDKTKVKEVIDRFIGQSSALTHTAANIEKLTKYISKNCDVKASIGCFACIKTLPEMSEVILRFQEGNNEVTRVIDLSNKVNDDKMIFINVH